MDLCEGKRRRGGNKCRRRDEVSGVLGGYSYGNGGGGRGC